MIEELIKQLDFTALLTAVTIMVPVAFWFGYEIGRRRTNRFWTRWQGGGVSLPVNHTKGVRS